MIRRDAVYKGKNIVAMIPARMGSVRLPMKNLALLNGRPLIYYAIRAAKEAAIFERIVVNSEDILFSKIARRYGVEFYKRPRELSTSNAKSDLVIHDFLKNNPCDILTWVNPIAPLQTPMEIKRIVKYFLKERLDSLITVRDAQVHCLYKKRPINFKANGLFARTQDLKAVQLFVYSVMMWRSGVFMRTFEREGHALLCGRVGYYPVSGPSSIIIKKDHDLLLAGYMMRGMTGDKICQIRYDRITRGLRDG